MPELTQEELKAAIWRMPVADRVAILSLTIIDGKRGSAIDAILALVELAGRMASLLGVDKRFRISERLRSIADKIELSPAYDERASR